MDHALFVREEITCIQVESARVLNKEISICRLHNVLQHG